MTYAALPVRGSLEAVPGQWKAGDKEGMIAVFNKEVLPEQLSPGMIVAELVATVMQTRICAV